MKNPLVVVKYAIQPTQPLPRPSIYLSHRPTVLSASPEPLRQRCPSAQAHQEVVSFELADCDARGIFHGEKRLISGRRNLVRCAAMRCGAVRCGAVRAKTRKPALSANKIDTDKGWACCTRREGKVREWKGSGSRALCLIWGRTRADCLAK